MNATSASNLEKGIQPKWNFKSETFIDFQHKVKVWADSHDRRHLLERELHDSDLPKHDAAMRIILLT